MDFLSGISSPKEKRGIGSPKNSTEEEIKKKIRAARVRKTNARSKGENFKIKEIDE